MLVGIFYFMLPVIFSDLHCYGMSERDPIFRFSLDRTTYPAETFGAFQQVMSSMFCSLHCFAFIDYRVVPYIGTFFHNGISLSAVGNTTRHGSGAEDCIVDFVDVLAASMAAFNAAI